MLNINRLTFSLFSIHSIHLSYQLSLPVFYHLNHSHSIFMDQNNSFSDGEFTYDPGHEHEVFIVSFCASLLYLYCNRFVNYIYRLTSGHSELTPSVSPGTVNSSVICFSKAMECLVGMMRGHLDIPFFYLGVLCLPFPISATGLIMSLSFITI